MNRLRPVFSFLLLLSFGRIAGAADDLIGTWFLAESGSAPRIRTEITFGIDGAFSMAFRRIPTEEENSEAPIQTTEGRWELDAEVVVLHLPSTAPVGVPKVERVVRWRIVSITGDALSIVDETDSSRRNWKKTEANRGPVTD
jgi:hypothetical protein